jgi:hypothetical protein
MVTKSGYNVAKMSIKVGTAEVKLVDSVETIESDMDPIFCLRHAARSEVARKFV